MALLQVEYLYTKVVATLTFEDVAILDGWSNQVDIPEYIVGQRYERGGKTYEYNKDGRFTEIK